MPNGTGPVETVPTNVTYRKQEEAFTTTDQHLEDMNIMVLINCLAWNPFLSFWYWHFKGKCIDSVNLTI